MSPEAAGPQVGTIAWTLALVAVVVLIGATLAGSMGTTTLALSSLAIAAVATAVSLWRGQHRVGTVASLWRKK